MKQNPGPIKRARPSQERRKNLGIYKGRALSFSIRNQDGQVGQLYHPLSITVNGPAERNVTFRCIFDTTSIWVALPPNFAHNLQAERLLRVRSGDGIPGVPDGKYKLESIQGIMDREGGKSNWAQPYTSASGATLPPKKDATANLVPSCTSAPPRTS